MGRGFEVTLAQFRKTEWARSLQWSIRQIEFIARLDIKDRKNCEADKILDAVMQQIGNLVDSLRVNR